MKTSIQWIVSADKQAAVLPVVTKHNWVDRGKQSLRLKDRKPVMNSGTPELMRHGWLAGCVFNGCSVTVIVGESGHGDTNSNPGRGW